MTKTTKAIDFEQQLESLEALVASLETGDLSLEDSMKSFEQGIKVARECQKALKEAVWTREMNSKLESREHSLLHSQDLLPRIRVIRDVHEIRHNGWIDLFVL